MKWQTVTTPNICQARNRKVYQGNDAAVCIERFLAWWHQKAVARK